MPNVIVDFVSYFNADDVDVAQFRMWHVEPLLSQAADLLDRCYKERMEYMSLLTQQKNIELEMMQLNASIASAVQEKNSGVWDIDIQRLESNTNTDVLISPYMQTAHQHAHDYSTVLQNAGWPPEAHSAAAAEYHSYIWLQEKMAQQGTSIIQLACERNKKIIKELVLNSQINIQQTKEAERTALTGVFNFDSRISGCCDRFKQSFEHAYVRLAAAEIGLEKIYGYYFSNPGEKKFTEIPADANKFDALVLSVRKALRWLVAFGQLDQAFTMVLSLSKLVPVWKDELKSGTNSLFKFSLTESFFAQHAYVRLRGISCYTQVNSEISPFAVDITLPSDAIYRHVRNRAGSQTVLEVDISQSELPSCLIGRVDSKSSPRSPEVCGVISLLNASPMSKTDNDTWSIELKSLREQVDNIDKLFVELNLTGRHIRSIF